MARGFCERGRVEESERTSERALCTSFPVRLEVPDPTRECTTSRKALLVRVQRSFPSLNRARPTVSLCKLKCSRCPNVTENEFRSSCSSSVQPRLKFPMHKVFYYKSISFIKKFFCTKIHVYFDSSLSFHC